MSVDTVATAREFLQRSLNRRHSTSKVMEAILALELPDLPSSLQREMEGLTFGSYAPSVMSEDFDQVVPLTSQLDSFHALFPTVGLPAGFNPEEVYAVNHVSTYRALIEDALEYLGVPAGKTASYAYQNRYNLNFAAGEAGSKKAFTKRLRYLAFFEERVDRLEDVLRLRHAQMQAKSRFAYQVDVSKLNDIALAYVAYITARANRRALFMLGGQSKTFDTVSSGLKAMLPEDTAWEQVALVTPVGDVLSRVPAEELGKLAGMFRNAMVDSALALGDLWPGLPERMREEMVMVRGVDSSRWNAYAGSFNTMRSAWIQLMIHLGMADIFDSYLPGKAPRLMAADIVWWGRSEGKELHEDTVLFNALPYPWEVVTGKQKLNRNAIEKAISTHKVEKALDTGWVGPRAKVADETASVEPVTLHGVAIGDPTLLPWLKSLGVFSGKKVTASKLFNEIISLPHGVVRDGDKIYPIVG